MPSDIDLKSVNLNTVISLAGFLGTFVLVGISWGTTQSNISELAQWREAHEVRHRDMQADEAAYRAVINQQIEAINRQLAKLDQMDYRVTSLEKQYENTDNRISRITESYSNQFADFRTQLSSISTQIALTNQTLQRMESQVVPPPRQQ
ncbi:hypothetical protein NKG99_20350 [Mesorhizobium sp. M1409]|uniref:hypothetical protein n=1 Tax=Mesorhizobium sp. M1409 TaxID=2957100 RepID=UPI0033382BF0